jgi:hypothetical protein
MRPMLPLLVATLLVVVITFPDGADAVWTPLANPGTTLVVKQVGNFAVIIYSNADSRQAHAPTAGERGERRHPAGRYLFLSASLSNLSLCQRCAPVCPCTEYSDGCAD